MKKDIEWLRRKVLDNKFMGHTIHIDVLFELMDELDELEVLSQEWIDRHKEFVGKRPDGTRVEVVEEKYLQNLLVPTLSKKKKVQLSQKTADELNRYKELGYSLKDLLVIAGSKQAQEKLARAWLDGYTVEEEQKYYALTKDKKTILLERWGDEPTPSTNPITEVHESDQFTEQEIKDYDPRYWPFAVKVEELEE